MGGRLRDLASSLITAGLFEILKFLVGLFFATGSSILLARIVSSVTPLIEQYKWLIAVISGSAGAWVFLSVYERLHRTRPKFPSLKSDFKVLEKTVCMVYKDRIHMEYTKGHRLKALREGLDRYLDKYLWTGDNPPTVRSKVRGHTFVQTVRRNFWQHYEVLFGRHLNRNEEVETELIWMLTDESRRAVPFISATVEEPTDILRLILEVPVEWGVGEVICEVSTGASVKKPLSSHSITVDQQGRAEWSVKDPKLLFHYEMRWSLPEEVKN